MLGQDGPCGSNGSAKQDSSPHFKHSTSSIKPRSTTKPCRPTFLFCRLASTRKLLLKAGAFGNRSRVEAIASGGSSAARRKADASNNDHGFLYSGGIFNRVDGAGAKGTQLTHIPNKGAFAGHLADQLDEIHGVTGH